MWYFYNTSVGSSSQWSHQTSAFAHQNTAFPQKLTKALQYRFCSNPISFPSPALNPTQSFLGKRKTFASAKAFFSSHLTFFPSLRVFYTQIQDLIVHLKGLMMIHRTIFTRAATAADVSWAKSASPHMSRDLIYWNAPVTVATPIKSTRTKIAFYTFYLNNIYSSIHQVRDGNMDTAETPLMPFNISYYENRKTQEMQTGTL